jgi:hypothetical protein
MKKKLTRAQRAARLAEQQASAAHARRVQARKRLREERLGWYRQYAQPIKPGEGQAEYQERRRWAECLRVDMLKDEADVLARVLARARRGWK